MLFIDAHPELLKEYCCPANPEEVIDVNTVSSGSNIRAVWSCSKCNGKWTARFADRSKGSGCPYCTGKKILAGYNDLASKFPEVLSEWDYSKNTIGPTEVAPFSMQRAFWICKNGHSYSMVIANKTAQKQGCPYCAGKKVLIGFNDLESRFPDIAKEWHPEKNSPLMPSEITFGSNKKVWWKCSICGNEWIATVNTRTTGEGCKVCGNKRGAKKRVDALLKKGITLAEAAPKLLKEWDYEKNSVSPDQVLFQSSQRCFWICDKGHSYDSRVADKVIGYGCPYCAGKRALKGFNDLESQFPELMKEWDFGNNIVKPDEITSGSSKIVYWKCQNCGESYTLSILEKRKRHLSYCPRCRKEFGSSIPEQIVYFYIKKAFPDAINGYRNKNLLGKREFDIFIPSINVGIEYDGKIWHSNRKRDKEKGYISTENGIKLIRLRETGAPEIADGAIIIVVDRKQTESDYQFMYGPINKLFDILHVNYNVDKPDIDIKRDTATVLAEFLRLKKERSLASEYPEVANDWHPEKNLSLTPQAVGARSGINVWWKCSVCGHEWQSRVIDRTTKGQGCFKCGCARTVEKRIQTKIESEGSLADRFPEVLKEWDYDKNTDVSPEKLTAFSNQKVWWKCSVCGYEWQAGISDRTYSKQGCMKCGRKKAVANKRKTIIAKAGSLADNYPDLLKDWDTEKNKNLSPDDFTVGTNKKVWWKCSTCGFEWISRVSQRTIRGQGCPQCYREKITENQISLDLSSLLPNSNTL